MHSTAAKPPPSPALALDQISELLSHVLASSLAVKSFTSRWQVLRSKLASLKSSISEISDSLHWSENPLLQTLLPNLHATLRRIQILSDQCTDPSFPAGKLLMQSDLDMATGWLSKQIHDIDLLLRSGVLRQSNAIVLSQPSPGSEEEDLVFFIRDLFTRLQIGSIEFKKKAMESLLQLLENDETAPNLVAKEGNIGYLIHLLDLNAHLSLREQAVSAVAILASATDQSRECIFEEGALGPLLRIIESSSQASKEKALMAVESITADPDNAWAISAYGGVSVLIEVCKSGSLTAQSHAVGAITNVASIEEIRISLGEEGAVPVIVQLLNSVQEKAANCVSILASSSENFRDLILQEKGLQRLLHLLYESSNSATLEHVLRAIHSLSASNSTARFLSSSISFIIQLSELIKHGTLVLQQLSVSLLANLSNMSDVNMRAIAGCMASLVKLMEMVKPVGLQERATQALVLLLTVRFNRKDLVRDEKSVMSLVRMLDPENEMVSKKFPVAVVSAIMAGGSKGCRKRLLAAGAHGYLQRLAEMEVAGAKRRCRDFQGIGLRVSSPGLGGNKQKSN